MLRFFLIAGFCAVLQDAEQLLKSAQSKLEKDDYRGAIREYDRALALDPNRVDAYVGRGRAQLGLKSVVDALDDFTRATDVDPMSAEAWAWHGRAQQIRGEHARAVRDYAKALELGLRNATILVWQASSLYDLERFEEAEGSCSEALGLGEQGLDLYTIRGKARCRLVNLRGAISDLTRAIQIDPKHLSAYWARGMAYFGEQSWENALRDMRRDGELDPSAPAMHALWIFLCRARMGEKDAASAEARTFLKNSSAAESGWSRKALLYLVDDLPEAELLRLAEGGDAGPAPVIRRMLHFFKGQKACLSGRAEEAREQFRKAVEGADSSGGLAALWARAELSFERRKEKRILVEDLESKLRSLPPCEMVFDLKLARRNDDDEEEFRTFTWSVDMRREEALLVIDGWKRKASKEFKVYCHLKDATAYIWSVGRGDKTYLKMDLALVKDLYRFGGEVRRLVPGAVSKMVASTACVKLGFLLDGKPSKDGKGTMQFTLGLGGTPSSWLPEVLDAEDAVMTIDGDAVSFALPAARKKIVVDRATGMLRALEAADYDGVTHSFKMRSSRPLERLPGTPVRSEALNVAPLGRDQVQNQMSQQESWLRGELGEAFENWDRIVKAEKEKDVAAIFTRWGARYAAGLHDYAVRTLAGQRIKQALDLGTWPAELRRNARQEAAKLATLSSDERKSVTEFIRNRIEQLIYRMETGLIEDFVDSRLHETIRSTLRRSFDYPEVDRVRREIYGDRLEELYREELDARSQF